MTHGEPEMPIDEAFDLIASVHRRQVLRHLLEEPDQPIYLDELVARIDDGGLSNSGISEVALAHQHLPRLADAGVIEYDHRSGAVRPTEAVEDLKPLLDTVEEAPRE